MNTSNPAYRLLLSRKFLLLLLDAVLSLVLHYNAVPAEVIAILQPVFVAIIVGIAYEDGQAKSAAPQQIQVNNPPTDSTHAS
jgi:hypothetical protein